MRRDDLLKLYAEIKPVILTKMNSFQKTWENGNVAIWQELCFCILTANTSASLALLTMEKLVSINFDSPSEILTVLKKWYRFYNTRTDYITTTREFLKQDCSLDLKQKIESFGSDKISLRDYFALTKLIKGLGFKESSHFLRNIGFLGYSILDKHIMRSLVEFDVVSSVKPPRNRSEYLTVETLMQQFAKNLSISVDHLDLLLWYRKTGEIIK